MQPDLIIVGCVAEKLAQPAPARELYTSQLWKARRGYAEASGRPWLIFSAMHGLVDPSRVLEPYDRTFSGCWAGQWRERLSREAVGRIVGAGYRCVEVHAGVSYHIDLGRMLRNLGVEVLLPLEGLGIGQQFTWYKQQAAARQESRT